MKKHQRMHLIFIRQYIKQIHGVQGQFCGWCLRSLSDSRLEPLISQYHLSTHSIPRRLDFSRDSLYLWIFLDSQGIGPSLFWQSLGFRSTTSPKRGVWQVSDSSHQSSLSHPRWDLSDWCFGWTLGRWDFTSNNGDKHCLNSSKIPDFPSLYSLCDLDLYFLENCNSQHRFLDQAVRCHDLYFYMFNDFAKYPISIYNWLLRWLISFIVPFAFTVYYPASYFLQDKNGLFNISGLILISFVFFFISFKLWDMG